MKKTNDSKLSAEELIKKTLMTDRMERIKFIKQDLKEARAAGRFCPDVRISVTLFAPGSAIPEIVISGFPYTVHETTVINGRLRVKFAPEAEKIAKVMREIVKRYRITDFYFNIKKVADGPAEEDV